MLPVLKQAGVVDSGGQGLMQALKGAYDGFLGKEVSLNGGGCLRQEPPHRQPVRQWMMWRSNTGTVPSLSSMLENHYDEKTEQEFKAFLESIGDSIVLVSDDGLVKVHVHTNDPGLAIQRALTYGSLSRMKIDNMREEHQEKLIKNAEKLAAAAEG